MLPLSQQLLQSGELLRRRLALRGELLDRRGLLGLPLLEELGPGLEVCAQRAVAVDLVERAHGDEPGEGVRTCLRIQVAAEQIGNVSTAGVHVAAHDGLLNHRAQRRQLGFGRGLVSLHLHDVVFDERQIGVRLRERLGGSVGPALGAGDVVGTGGGRSETTDRSDQETCEEEPGGPTAHDGRPR